MHVGARAAGGQPIGILFRSIVAPARPSSVPFLWPYSTFSATIATTAEEEDATSTIGTEFEAIPDPMARADLVTTTDYRITSSVVLSRPPLLTPELQEFEESFYFYQRRLNQRLALPFTRYFYFKRDTPADAEWKEKQKKRSEADKWTGFGPRGWADELLVGDNRHKAGEDYGYRRLVETTVTGEDQSLDEGNADESKRTLGLPLPRETQADRENNVRRLDRKMSRTLYLLVKKKDAKWNEWRFPQSTLVGRENLRKGAERTLEQAAGVNMNTWFVGNVPIGHWVKMFPGAAEDGKIGEKVFFMKARILAGQADLKAGSLGLEDFQWLTKEEIQPNVGTEYWSKVKSILATR